MQPNKKMMVSWDSQEVITTGLRLGVIALLIFFCAKIAAPFIMLLLWGLILSIMLYPLQQNLAKRFSGRQGRASSLIVLIGIIFIVLPCIVVGNSFIHQAQGINSAIEHKSFTIKQPDIKVAEWPVIGEKVYKAWGDVATNLSGFVEANKAVIVKVSKKSLSIIGNLMSTVALVIAALIVAGIMMAYGEAGKKSTRRIISSIAGTKNGSNLQTLIVATVRSVATGVLGVAFIQALLFGIGFYLCGIPAAGLLALVVLFIGILQLPALIVALPVIGYVWAVGDASVTVNILLTIYFIVAGLADNVLKPLLLGRGVDAPMPIILMGALGGMMASGFIGLFLGAVFLATGYQLFMNWVDHRLQDQAEITDSAKTICE